MSASAGFYDDRRPEQPIFVRSRVGARFSAACALCFIRSTSTSDYAQEVLGCFAVRSPTSWGFGRFRSGVSGAIPPRHACVGEDISPELSWPPGPAGTVTYAVVLGNLDAGPLDPSRVTWVIWNIPSAVTTLPEDLGASPTPAAIPGAIQVSGVASALRRYYRGPCAVGRYQLKRYAIGETLTTSALATPAQMEFLVESAAVLETLSLVADYRGY